MAAQRMKKYGAILADPPWRFKTWSPAGEGRSASQHYRTMADPQIAAIDSVNRAAADDCALFLWCIDSMLPEALATIEAWGFTYKTVAFTWVKTLPSGKEPMGTGYWTRANPETCLLATRGKPKRLGRGVRQLLTADRREHSRKPDEVYKRIEELVGGPYLELFARQAWPGWDQTGDEMDRFAPPIRKRVRA